MGDPPLMMVAEMPIETGAGKNLVFEAVAQAFDRFEPSAARRLVFEINWRAIATTNYDLYMKKAYDGSKKRLQSLLPFIKADEPIATRKVGVTHPLEYLKLHGCLATSDTLP